MDSSPPLTAVIIDISKSRSHADRAALQREIETAFGRVNSEVPALQPIAPTVSDEFQAVYADLALTLRATLLARLVLPEGIECRFGIGRGDVVIVGSGVVGAVQDGSAWWTARKAIDEARQHQYSKLGFVRTWYNAESPEDALVNAYLLARDQIVGGMNPRARRLLLGQLLGSTQAQLALDEGISQSAVSQNLSRSGANAIVAGAALIAKDAR
ncbi:hypothetical protein HD599_002112 [Conyzicola lurida]|uniref:SatD family protein n=1 Tax=Conyzicola lurida TaxID=1172621 RepID=A0A841AQT9_9MICO|nr:SatD family protein [Conyzicola lurida]MBB5843789.1 hypothetical protein [Conyzicola lurida]